jgi:hypothetical protein
MSYKGEKIAKAIEALLESKLADALGAVGGRWAGDPVDLDTDVEFLFGHHPTVLERPKADFPIIAVMAAESTPVPTSDQWILPTKSYETFVDVFVAGDDEEEVSKRLLRFCEAVVDVMEANREVGSGLNQTDSPSLSPSEVNRQHEPGMNVEFFTQFARLLVTIQA